MHSSIPTTPEACDRTGSTLPHGFLLAAHRGHQTRLFYGSSYGSAAVHNDHGQIETTSNTCIDSGNTCTALTHALKKPPQTAIDGGPALTELVERDRTCTDRTSHDIGRSAREGYNADASLHMRERYI